MTERNVIYQGKVVELGIEHVRLPGGAECELEIVRHPGGAAVVALDDMGRICMLRQYRHAVGGWIWELPAGKLEANEDPLHTAQRELEEEAGLHADRWESLGDIVTTPGFCDEVIHLFIARGLSRLATRHERSEAIEVFWWSRAEAMAKLWQFELRDAKTVVALYRWLSADFASAGI